MGLAFKFFIQGQGKLDDIYIELLDRVKKL